MKRRKTRTVRRFVGRIAIALPALLLSVAIVNAAARSRGTIGLGGEWVLVFLIWWMNAYIADYLMNGPANRRDAHATCNTNRYGK